MYDTCRKFLSDFYLGFQLPKCLYVLTLVVNEVKVDIDSPRKIKICHLFCINAETALWGFSSFLILKD